MGPREPRGMRPGKIVSGNALMGRLGYVSAGRRAQIHRAIHQVAKQCLSQLKGVGLARNHLFRAGRVGMRIDRGNKEPGRARRRVCNTTEGSCSQRSPLPRLNQLGLDGLGRQLARRSARILAERSSPVAINLDNDRLESALCAAINRRNAPTGGGRVANAFTFFVGKE